MSIPIVTEECAVAVLEKMHTDHNGAAEWTFANAGKFGDEQPALFYAITESLGNLFGEGEEETIRATKSLYLVMMSYGIIKAAVEAQQLNDMFGEDE